MIESLDGAKPDFPVWGTVLPNLTGSNVAREVLLDAKVDPRIPAFSTVMACSTSMIGAMEAAAMLDNDARSLALVGGTESMSRVQIGLTQRSRLAAQILASAHLRREVATDRALRAHRYRALYSEPLTNRSTGKSMGQHMEESVPAR